MNISTNRWMVKMFELIDKSPTLQRMAWAVIRIGGTVLIVHAVRWW